MLGKCEVRGACSLFLFLSLCLSSLFLPPAPPIPSPQPLRLSMPWSSADATWIARGRDGREGRGRTRERWLKHIFESQEGIFFFSQTEQTDGNLSVSSQISSQNCGGGVGRKHRLTHVRTHADAYTHARTHTHTK